VRVIALGGLKYSFVKTQTMAKKNREMPLSSSNKLADETNNSTIRVCEDTKDSVVVQPGTVQSPGLYIQFLTHSLQPSISCRFLAFFLHRCIYNCYLTLFLQIAVRVARGRFLTVFLHEKV
jgi:hypothetical protein